VHQWDLATKKEVAKLQGHSTRTTCLHSDTMGGYTLVTGSQDTKAKVWDLRTQKCVNTFREHSGCINTI
jgi:WD40 repeat protein